MLHDNPGLDEILVPFLPRSQLAFPNEDAHGHFAHGRKGKERDHDKRRDLARIGVRKGSSEDSSPQTPKAKKNDDEARYHQLRQGNSYSDYEPDEPRREACHHGASLLSSLTEQSLKQT